jgi:hypothetical protein
MPNLKRPWVQGGPDAVDGDQQIAPLWVGDLRARLV